MFHGAGEIGLSLLLPSRRQDMHDARRAVATSLRAEREPGRKGRWRTPALRSFGPVSDWPAAQPCSIPHRSPIGNKADPRRETPRKSYALPRTSRERIETVHEREHSGAAVSRRKHAEVLRQSCSAPDVVMGPQPGFRHQCRPMARKCCPSQSALTAPRRRHPPCRTGRCAGDNC